MMFRENKYRPTFNTFVRGDPIAVIFIYPFICSCM